MKSVLLKLEVLGFLLLLLSAIAISVLLFPILLVLGISSYSAVSWMDDFVNFVQDKGQSLRDRLAREESNDK